ncbi:hypothetical protein FGO68_gene5270 [Halteria grandinella]|uniref:Uncharacterized protein n=1 Tax=Halteria grandinella TaxID=5974 RepID=A0A8J8T978_HALGN|nr:hypothetical protein FGO68_gene5270 [Halteria grandinella]
MIFGRHTQKEKFMLGIGSATLPLGNKPLQSIFGTKQPVQHTGYDHEGVGSSSQKQLLISLQRSMGDGQQQQQQIDLRSHIERLSLKELSDLKHLMNEASEKKRLQNRNMNGLSQNINVSTSQGENLLSHIFGGGISGGSSTGSGSQGSGFFSGPAVSGSGATRVHSSLSNLKKQGDFPMHHHNERHTDHHQYNSLQMGGNNILGNMPSHYSSMQNGFTHQNHPTRNLGLRQIHSQQLGGGPLNTMMAGSPKLEQAYAQERNILLRDESIDHEHQVKVEILKNLLQDNRLIESVQKDIAKSYTPQYTQSLNQVAPSSMMQNNAKSHVSLPSMPSHGGIITPMTVSQGSPSNLYYTQMQQQQNILQPRSTGEEQNRNSLDSQLFRGFSQSQLQISPQFQTLPSIGQNHQQLTMQAFEQSLQNQFASQTSQEQTPASIIAPMGQQISQAMANAFGRKSALAGGLKSQLGMNRGSLDNLMGGASHSSLNLLNNAPPELTQIGNNMVGLANSQKHSPSHLMIAHNFLNQGQQITSPSHENTYNHIQQLQKKTSSQSLLSELTNQLIGYKPQLDEEELLRQKSSGLFSQSLGQQKPGLMISTASDQLNQIGKGRYLQNQRINEEPEEEAAGDDLYNMLNEIREMVRDVHKSTNNDTLSVMTNDKLSHKPNYSSPAIKDAEKQRQTLKVLPAPERPSIFSPTKIQAINNRAESTTRGDLDTHKTTENESEYTPHTNIKKDKDQKEKKKDKKEKKEKKEKKKNKKDKKKRKENSDEELQEENKPISLPIKSKPFDNEERKSVIRYEQYDRAKTPDKSPNQRPPHSPQKASIDKNSSPVNSGALTPAQKLTQQKSQGNLLQVPPPRKSISKVRQLYPLTIIIIINQIRREDLRFLQERR